MKTFILSIAFSLIATTLLAQQQFSIKSGDLPLGYKLILTYNDKNQYKTDDTVTINSQKHPILFWGEIAEPHLATLQLYTSDNEQLVYQQFFLCADTTEIIHIDITKRSAQIEGGPEQTIFQARNDQIAQKRTAFNNGKLDELAVLIRELLNEESKDSVALQALRQERAVLSEQWEVQETKMHLDFIQQNPSSLVSAQSLAYVAGYAEDNILREHYNILDQHIKESHAARKVAGYLRGKETIVFGRKAPDFSQPSTEHQIITLSNYAGKYVLLDFWASWCIPCRAENPNLVKAYQDFNTYGFEILGISLDDNRERWTNAIKEDNLSWINVSDLKGWNNAVSTQYGVYSIPQNVLIDPKGTIVGKNLKGRALLEKLAELFL